MRNSWKIKFTISCEIRSGVSSTTSTKWKYRPQIFWRTLKSVSNIFSSQYVTSVLPSTLPITPLAADKWLRNFYPASAGYSCLTMGLLLLPWVISHSKKMKSTMKNKSNRKNGVGQKKVLLRRNFSVNASKWLWQTFRTCIKNSRTWKWWSLGSSWDSFTIWTTTSFRIS